MNELSLNGLMYIPCSQAAAASRSLPEGYGSVLARHLTSNASLHKDVHVGDDQGYTISLFHSTIITFLYR